MKGRGSSMYSIVWRQFAIYHHGTTGETEPSQGKQNPVPGVEWFAFSMV